MSDGNGKSPEEEFHELGPDLAELVLASSQQTHSPVSQYVIPWKGPSDPLYDSLITELMSESTEEEAMDLDSMANFTISGALQQPIGSGELKDQHSSVRVVFGSDDAHGGCALDAGQVVSIGAKPEAETPVRVTHEPQLLSQASIPKPWEQQDGQSVHSSSDVSSIQQDDSDHKPDLDAKVDYMKNVLGRYDDIVQANSSNGKIQVHQVVSFLLLANENNPIKMNLGGILVFCDAKGAPGTRSCNFRAADTKVMGLIWQKIKENRNGNFDTFARAMRVGRERSKGYFSYLDSGKGSKKKVYKLGSKLVQEMKKMEELLPQIC